MKKREVNAFLRRCKTGKYLDAAKVKAEPKEIRESAIRFLMRKDYPIVAPLLSEAGMEMIKSLQTCGYLHIVNTGYFTFLCKCNHIHNGDPKTNKLNQYL